MYQMIIFYGIENKYTYSKLYFGYISAILKLTLLLYSIPNINVRQLVLSFKKYSENLIHWCGVIVSTSDSNIY